MITTSLGKVPRILVRITPEDIRALTEQQIVRDDGRTIWLNIHHQSKADFMPDRFKWGIRFAKVEAVSPGAIGILPGDTAILDYTVYANAFIELKDGTVFPAPNVTVDDRDLLIAVPCATTYHEKDIRPSDNSPLLAAVGDVDVTGMVLGIIRGKTLYPNPFYVFCQFEVQQLYNILKEDGKTYYPYHDQSYIRRTVLAAHPDSGVVPGQIVLAPYDSNIELEVMGFLFDIIPVGDLWGVEERADQLGTQDSNNVKHINNG